MNTRIKDPRHVTRALFAIGVLLVIANQYQPVACAQTVDGTRPATVIRQEPKGEGAAQRSRVPAVTVLDPLLSSLLAELPPMPFSVASAPGYEPSAATLPEPPADFGATFFSILKKVWQTGGQDPDQIEMARYYVYEPKHADVIYSNVAKEDYVFIGILVGLKAARNQSLPGGGKFDYNACMAPITLFNTVFSKSGEFMKKYSQDEHINALAQQGNSKAKEEAQSNLSEYIPYWKEIPDICHFTFNTNFQREKDVKNTVTGGARTVKASYEDFNNGNVVDGVGKLISIGLNGKAACSLADDMIAGGAIGRIPVLGNLAKGACATFAGKIIAGIGSGIKTGINAVGDFIGDAGCTIGIGSCTGDKPVDGFFNSNLEVLIENWTLNPAPAADAWAANWYSKIMHNKCKQGTGASDQRCDAAWVGIVTSAKGMSAKLRRESQLAYDSLYKPKLNEIALYPVPSDGIFKSVSLPVQQINQTCGQNLIAKYPWPGPQQFQKHNEIFYTLCFQAQTRSDLSSTGKSFDTQVAERRAAIANALDASHCLLNNKAKPFERVCTSYTARQSCSTGLAPFGVDAATAGSKYCKLNNIVASANVAQAVQQKTACKTKPGSPLAFATLCPSYKDQRLCIQTVKAIPGIDPSVYLGCDVDVAKVNKDITDSASEPWAALLVSVWTPRCLDEICVKEVKQLGKDMVIGAKLLQMAKPDESSLRIQGMISRDYGVKFQKAVDDSKRRKARR